MHHLCNDISRLFLTCLNAKACYSLFTAQKQISIYLAPSYTESLKVVHTTRSFKLENGYSYGNNYSQYRYFPDGSHVRIHFDEVHAYYQCYDKHGQGQGLYEQWRISIELGHLPFPQRWDHEIDAINQTSRGFYRNGNADKVHIDFLSREIRVYVNDYQRLKITPNDSDQRREAYVKYACDFYNMFCRDSIRT